MSRRLGFLAAVAFAVVGFSVLSLVPNRADENLKANLDLPFDAGGEEEEEEVGPEIVVFYGESYEATTVVFALDESGSMNEAMRWQIQTREVTKAISQLSDRAKFGVVFYGSKVTAMQDKPLEATGSGKGRGISFVLSRHPQGDTCLGEGAIKALEVAKRSADKHRSVIVTSDGRPDNCATGQAASPEEKERILQMTLAANPGRLIKLHTVWVGTASDSDAIDFMKRLATAHGGTFRQVSR